jgi:hypothetical protein
MLRASCAVLGVFAALAAGAAQAQPITLSAQDLDAVTAGAITVGAQSHAAATGAFNLSQTNSAALATSTQGTKPAISSQVGAASGTAVAVGAGAGGSAATSVTTAGSADGTFVFSRSVSWKLTVLSGEISGGFTVVSGHTGAFLLGGP